MGLVEDLVADRELGASLSTPNWDQPEAFVVAREAAARHNARVDNALPTKKGGWDARATAVRIDGDQGRHPWSVVGHGETADAALLDLAAQLDAKPVVSSATATCPTCGQALP
jgi:hypothetical protein